MEAFRELKKEVVDEHLSNNIINDKGENVSQNESLKNVKMDQFLITSPVRIKVNFEIDLVAVILLISGLITRLYHLEEPRNIVYV